jgi:hypothetical protein
MIHFTLIMCCILVCNSFFIPCKIAEDQKDYQKIIKYQKSIIKELIIKDYRLSKNQRKEVESGI